MRIIRRGKTPAELALARIEDIVENAEWHCVLDKRVSPPVQTAVLNVIRQYRETETREDGANGG